MWPWKPCLSLFHAYRGLIIIFGWIVQSTLCARQCGCVLATKSKYAESMFLYDKRPVIRAYNYPAE